MPETKKPLAELVPDGVRLFSAWGAAEAAGFEHVRDTEDGSRVFHCCGQVVCIESLLGPYRVHCKACGNAIRDMFGPHFGNGSAFFFDPEKVDAGGGSWFVESEWDARRGDDA